MAVTKRTRFEVLRRDEHTCQYCGAKAPDVVLTIDHVMPVSLGGDDKPGNLVTACRECNSGKASISPDSPLVQGLNERAAAYAMGMIDKMTRFRQDLESLDAFVDEFNELWFDWTFTSPSRSDSYHQPLPPDYEMSLLKWKQIGVPMRAFELAISKAMSKVGIRGDFGRFQYMAGIINRMLDDREIDLHLAEDSAAVFTQKEHDRARFAQHWKGFAAGKAHARAKAVVLDELRNLVDGTRAVQDEDSGVWKVERIGAG